MNLTQRTHEFFSENLTIEDALPTQIPAYVNSYSYIFGVSTLSAFGLLVITGFIMTLFGPNWYHLTRVGRFFNSLHFWGVQLFFFALVLHFFNKYLIAAWRDGRWKTWMWGLIALGVSIFTGLTGFLAQSNWDSQWISVQAKDAMNSLGIGALFNTMNFTQVLTMHIFLLPVLLGVIILIHLYYIRSEGPVKPFGRGE